MIDSVLNGYREKDASPDPLPRNHSRASVIKWEPSVVQSHTDEKLLEIYANSALPSQDLVIVLIEHQSPKSCRVSIHFFLLIMCKHHSLFLSNFSVPIYQT